MAAFELKWVSDASVLDKMILVKQMESMLNKRLSLADFDTDLVQIREIYIVMQALHPMSISRKENKAKFVAKKKRLEIYIQLELAEISEIDPEDVPEVLTDALIMGIATQVDLNGFDQFALCEAMDAVL